VVYIHSAMAYTCDKCKQTVVYIHRNNSEMQESTCCHAVCQEIDEFSFTGRQPQHTDKIKYFTRYSSDVLEVWWDICAHFVADCEQVKEL